MTQSNLFGTLFLGTRSVRVALERAELMQANLAAFCPNCGDTWARFVKPFPTVWVIQLLPCIKCPELFGSRQIPGALTGFVDNFPDEFVEREFKLHLAFYRKRHGLQPSSPLTDSSRYTTDPAVGF